MNHRSRRPNARALALFALMPLIGAMSSSSLDGPVRTDDVAIQSVVDPKVGSGILAIYAEVAGVTSQHDKRNYFILYMGPGQTLPAVGTRCSIDYRDGKLMDWGGSGSIAEHFACSDGRHWPHGTPASRP
jgi:hypothetical protein